MWYQGQKRTYSRARIASIAAAIGCVFAGGSAVAEDANPAGAAKYKVAKFKIPRPTTSVSANPVVPVALPPTRSITQAIDPDRVLVIQSALVARGCYDGALDAQWNDTTRRVVARAVRLLDLGVDARNPNDELVEALLRPQAGDCLSVIATRAPLETVPLEAAPKPALEWSLTDVIAAWRTTEIGATSTLINQDPAFVTALQAALVARNCFNGAIDGRWSDTTWYALMAFAKTTGVAVSDATIDTGLIETVLSYPRTSCEAAPDARSGKGPKAIASTPKAKRRTAQLNRRRRSSGITVRLGRSRGPAVFIRPVGVGRF